MFKLQNQVMTGMKFTTAREDPIGAAHVMTTSSFKNRIAQLQKNITSAKDYLGHTENVMADVTDMMRSAYSLAIQGASSAVDTEARVAMGNQIEILQRRLVELANTQGSQGQYVFAGHMSNNKPFANSPPNITFHADQNAIVAEIRPAEVMITNFTGARDLFFNLYNSLEKLQNNLISGNVTQISNDNIAEIQRLLGNVSQVRADAGAKIQSLTKVEAQNVRRLDDLTQDIADVQEVDLAEALTRYQSAETAYSAALQMTAKGFELSLMDFLR